LELLQTLYTLFTDHTGALKISVLTFQRPGEIRKLKKEYFYREERCFKFTASKTKQLHIVPLSDQALT
jgi:integrase